MTKHWPSDRVGKKQAQRAEITKCLIEMQKRITELWKETNKMVSERKKGGENERDLRSGD